VELGNLGGGEGVAVLLGVDMGVVEDFIASVVSSMHSKIQ